MDKLKRNRQILAVADKICDSLDCGKDTEAYVTAKQAAGWTVDILGNNNRILRCEGVVLSAAELQQARDVAAMMYTSAWCAQFTTQEVADALGLTPQAIRYACVEGKLLGAERDEYGVWGIPRYYADRETYKAAVGTAGRQKAHREGDVDVGTD